MSDYLQAIATILSLINPAICGAIFAGIESGRPARSQIVDATKAMAIILVILTTAALAGTTVLNAFGISIDAFQVAGGSVLVWMGFVMLRGTDSKAPPEGSDSTGDPALTPLVLFAASPGTITGVITIAATHSPHEIPTTALVAVGIAIALTWLALLVTAKMPSSKGSKGLVHDVTTRFMGLIVLAMGVQFGLTGIRSFMASA